MSTEAFDRTAGEVLRQARGQRRRWAILVSSLIAIACALLGLAVITFVNIKSDDARQEAIDETLASIEGLCESGAIDCRGHRGLPGPKGEPGGRVVKIECGPSGRFVFRMSTGRTWRVGDCIAERGPRGLTGPRGRTGPRGKVGPVGPRGQTGKSGKTGPRGKSGPRGSAGSPGKSGGKGKGR